ncbi:MAG: penicillin-binding protein [Patescibacteria group bacterium]|nr:penicillin-binding protein [Patescibacteria group bacterium]
MKKIMAHFGIPAKQLTQIIATIGLIGGSIVILWLLTLRIPDFGSYENRIIAESTKLYDRTGKVLLYNAHDQIRRTVVPLSEISDQAENASIAIEDANFYNHYGVEPLAIIRAVVVNINTGRLEQGGSTITQQVIKNTLLTQDKKITRKIKEWILSIKLERKLTKKQILELYLNEIPYGGNLYGIEEASKAFFGKSARDITLAESAYLAALPQAPSYLSPYGNHPDKLEERKNLVLKRMLAQKFITEKDYNDAKKEKVLFAKPDNRSIKAPHFVFYVLEQLAEKYGDDEVRNGGLRVITTLDWEAQQKAEEIVKRYGEQNRASYNAGNAGLVVMDPKNGQILTMVGSVDYFDVEHEGNFNITTAKRQPGSAFKPFVYATAFNEGYTADTVVFDIPTEFNASCSASHTPLVSGTNCYAPVNYDGTYAGPITFRNALAQSRNIPAVKALYLAGIKDSFDTARKMGITTLEDYRRYGLTLVLGGGEVTLVDMTNAYSVFANDGVFNPKISILEIRDSDRKILQKFEDNSNQILPPNTARLISNILSDDAARAPVFGAGSPLNVPGHQVAVKTGTTNDYRDGWIVGYTPSVTVGAWVGNNNNTPMDKRVAGIIVAPMWNAFMREYLAGLPNEYFIAPEPTPTDLKPVLRGSWQGGSGSIFDQGGSVHSILYYVDKDNPREPAPANPSSDPQFRNWEASVMSWKGQTGYIETATQDDETNVEPGELDIKIENISKKYDKEDEVIINLERYSGVASVKFYLNDTYLGTLTKKPYRFSFYPSEMSDIKNRNTIKVIGYDINNNSKEDTEVLNIKI